MLVPALIAAYMIGVALALLHGFDNRLCNNYDPVDVFIYHVFNVVMAILWPVLIGITLCIMLYRKLSESWRQ